MVTAGRVAADLREDSAIHANIDVIGHGVEMADRLREQFGKRIGDINVAEIASEADRLANQRAEFYWELRTLFEQRATRSRPISSPLYEEISVTMAPAVTDTSCQWMS